MAGSTFGTIFRITTWGESHGKALGVVIDGCPAGLPLEEAHIQSYLDRRKPGRTGISTQRREEDAVEILSGTFEGRTTGTPLMLMVRNTSQISGDYSEIAPTYRPGHADYTFDQKYGFRDWNSVLAAVGHGGLKEGQIINKMMERYEKDHRKELTNEEVLAAVAENEVAKKPMKVRSKSGILVKGMHNLAVRFSKCCSPVPGDEIVGFITRGRGVAIHRTDCINMLNLPEMERVRLIDAEWEGKPDEMSGEKYMVEIMVYANNRNGLLADISRALTEKDIDILSLNTRINKQGLATMAIAFEINNREELNRIVEKIRSIESVVDIERTTG